MIYLVPIQTAQNNFSSHRAQWGRKPSLSWVSTYWKYPSQKAVCPRIAFQIDTQRWSGISKMCQQNKVGFFVNACLFLLLWALLLLLFKTKQILLVIPPQVNIIHPNSLFITILAIGHISKCIPYRKIFNLKCIQEIKNF